MVTTGSVSEPAHCVHGGEVGEPVRGRLPLTGVFVLILKKLPEGGYGGLYPIEHHRLLMIRCDGR